MGGRAAVLGLTHRCAALGVLRLHKRFIGLAMRITVTAGLDERRPFCSIYCREGTLVAGADSATGVPNVHESASLNIHDGGDGRRGGCLVQGVSTGGMLGLVSAPQTEIR
jgi:hypothetical protein